MQPFQAVQFFVGQLSQLNEVLVVLLTTVGTAIFFDSVSLYLSETDTSTVKPVLTEIATDIESEIRKFYTMYQDWKRLKRK